MLAIDKGFGKKNGQLLKSLELPGQVEVTRIELVSKHVLQKSSTCLFCFVVSGIDWIRLRRIKTNNRSTP